MKILVLYSWEENTEYAQQWTMALCEELNRYENVEISCDMFFAPKSNVKKDLKDKILQADKILVVVTNNYNFKIENGIGMVFYEEQIYKSVIKESSSDDKILFLLKDKNVTLPKGWEGYNRIDVSRLNATEYFEMTNSEKRELFESIIRFCSSVPANKIQMKSKKKALPKPKTVRSFKKIFSSYYLEGEKKKPLRKQEEDLIKYIKKNLEQDSFVYRYIKAGLSADVNLDGRLTPELFIKHFWVKGDSDKENLYNSIVKNLFSSDHHNMLCIQSDGGSGKSTFIRTLGHKDEHKVRKNDIYNNIIFAINSGTYMQNVHYICNFQRFCSSNCCRNSSNCI